MEWLIGYLSPNKCRNAAIEDSLQSKGRKAFMEYIHICFIHRPFIPISLIALPFFAFGCSHTYRPTICRASKPTGPISYIIKKCATYELFIKKILIIFKK